jgi:hypothetical protein
MTIKIVPAEVKPDAGKARMMRRDQNAGSALRVKKIFIIFLYSVAHFHQISPLDDSQQLA